MNGASNALLAALQPVNANLTALAGLPGTNVLAFVSQLPSSGSLTNLTNSRVAYLDASGNNATALVGNPSRPFATANAAVAALNALSPTMSTNNPCALLVGVGSFGDITATNLAGLNVIGHGAGASRLGQIFSQGYNIDITCAAVHSVLFSNINSQAVAGGKRGGHVTLRGVRARYILAAGTTGVDGATTGGHGGDVWLYDSIVEGSAGINNTGGDGLDSGDPAVPYNGGNGGKQTLVRSWVRGGNSTNVKGHGTNDGDDGSDGSAVLIWSSVKDDDLVNVTGRAAVDDATGGGTVDTEARAALNSLLALLRTQGWLAP